MQREGARERKIYTPAGEGGTKGATVSVTNPHHGTVGKLNKQPETDHAAIPLIFQT